jgi:hypothetical protein
MKYSVEVKLKRDALLEEGSVIASFRNGGGEGWTIWYENGIVSARVGDEWAWATCRFKASIDETHLEWRIIGDRHEMWQNGVQESEVMSRLQLPEDGVLYVGEDPMHPAERTEGIMSVEVKRG